MILTRPMSYDINTFQVQCFNVSSLKTKPNKKFTNEEIFDFMQNAHYNWSRSLRK